jgi:hypothetical protein
MQIWHPPRQGYPPAILRQPQVSFWITSTVLATATEGESLLESVWAQLQTEMLESEIA